MEIERLNYQTLSVNERKSVLLFENETLPADVEQKLEAVDLSVLKSTQFDEIVDQILGYKNLSEIERRREGQVTASRLGEAKWSKQSASNGFSSAYRDIKAILSTSGMQDGDRFVDIGSSYGRIGCVVGANFPNTQFIGYEIVPERMAEAKRIAKGLELHNVSYFHEDVSADGFKMPEADWYFLYDSLNNDTLPYLLEKMHTMLKNRNARVMVKYTGNLNKYSKSPYLKLISKTGEKDSFGECWFYGLK